MSTLPTPLLNLDSYSNAELKTQGVESGEISSNKELKPSKQTQRSLKKKIKTLLSKRQHQEGITLTTVSKATLKGSTFSNI